MGWSVVKQPNGKYAIFSTISEECLCYDATPEQLKNYYIKEKQERIVREAEEFVKQGIERANGECGPEPYVTDVKEQIRHWRHAQNVPEADEWLQKVCAAFDLEVPDAWEPGWDSPE